MTPAPELIPEHITNLTPEQIAAVRAKAKSDKLYLANVVLGYNFCEDVHRELFDTLIPYSKDRTWRDQSPIKKRLILWPRSHYKSTAIIVDVIQLILVHPDIRIFLMQATLKTTQTLLREILAHFTGDAQGSRLKALFPEFCADNARGMLANASRFTTPARQRKQTKEATVTCVSPRANKTGQHADILFADDLVTAENYRSAKLLEKVRQDFMMALPLIDPPHYVVVTGTRYSFGDLYETIIRQDANKGEWTLSVKTCWTDDGKDIRFPQRQKANGEFIGFTREGLLQLRAADPVMFASQYLNQPASTAHQTFTEEMLEARVVDAAKVPDTLGPALMFIDLANGADERSDDCVILLAKVDHLGKIWITHCRGGQWDPYARTQQILDVCMKVERPVRIYLEKSAAGKEYVTTLQLFSQVQGVVLPVEFLKSDTRADAKAIRIAALRGYFKTDRLFFVAGLTAWAKMKDQFVKWTGDRHAHDDYPDTVALAAQHFAATTEVIKPLSAERYPFLKAIEAQEAAESYMTGSAMPAPVNEMGDFFAA